MPRKITVAVCTFNRAPLLRKCLDGLAAQTIILGNMQVVVVDNNSSDDTAEVCKAFSSKLPDLKYVFEPKQGLSRARNRALQEAGAPIIIYIDDDTVPYPTWAKKFIEAFDRYPD